MDQSTKQWLKRSFQLWLVCKVTTIVFWMLLVGVPLSIVLVWVVVSLLS